MYVIFERGVEILTSEIYETLAQCQAATEPYQYCLFIAQ
jgi:hypothetical protein